jgi:hypothetical protein
MCVSSYKKVHKLYEISMVPARKEKRPGFSARPSSGSN